MDGQNGGYRPRTAGDRSESSENGRGIRDWQKNTWFGPAPLNNNPFDEPEDSPELVESRSQNVTEREGPFWQEPSKGYTSQQTSGGRQEAGGRKKTEQGTGRGRVLRWGVGAVLLIVAVVLILRFAVFSVKEILVTGNDRMSAEEIIRISGVRRGDNILSINEKNVEERIASDYRLQFRYMVCDLPSTVVLSIREREPCCWLTYCGIMYVMDKNRMVLRESEDPADQPEDLVEIKGLEVRSNTLVGQYINLGSETQQSIFTELFLEMKVLGCVDRIKEADIRDTNSILLVTKTGYTAGLGSRENLHAKLRSLLLIEDELQQMGRFGGTINLSNPEAPIYTP